MSDLGVRLKALIPDFGGFLSDPQSYRDMARNALGMVGSPLPSGPGPIMARRLGVEGDPDYLKKMLGIGLGGLTVYHGSPYKFDKFDMSKVGTGEGAQAYGHGLYFAENPKTANIYATTLAKRADDPNYWAYGEGAKANLPVSLGPPELKELEVLGQKMRVRGNLPVNEMDRWRELHDIKTAREIAIEAVKPKPNLYKVDLPDDQIAKMLDWDAPLSQQQHLFENVGPYGDEFKFKHLLERLGVDPATTTGRDLLTNVMGIGRSSEKAAAISKSLKEFGIPGISYLDQGSRSAGQGTRNFVVFDDQLPKILGRE